MEQPVFTISEFCAAHRISRSALYNSWKDGTGPRIFRVGTKVLIRREAAEAWLAERERVTNSSRPEDGASAVQAA
jgi:predicted DNA-binding transcriptional regulator AlpA